MARMHTRRKGKSGSKKPMEAKKPFWLNKRTKEIELLIIKLAREGNSSSKIGLILRDAYGIPDVRVLLKKSITQVLREKKLEKAIPEDLIALIKKTIQIKKHMEENHQDMVAKRGLLLAEAKIKRLIKYYKGTGRIAEDWKFDPEKAKILVQ